MYYHHETPRIAPPLPQAAEARLQLHPAGTEHTTATEQRRPRPKTAPAPLVLPGFLHPPSLYSLPWRFHPRRTQTQAPSPAVSQVVFPKFNDYLTNIWRGICQSCGLVCMQVANSPPPLPPPWGGGTNRPISLAQRI